MHIQGLITLVESSSNQEPYQRVVEIEFLLLWLVNKQSNWHSERPQGDALKAIVIIKLILLTGESSGKTLFTAKMTE